MTEPHAIPSLPDMMRRIEVWMVDRAKGPEVSDDLQAEVGHFMDVGLHEGADPFMFIAVGKGCHTVAEERRQRGDPAMGYCFYHFGQILLDRAVEMLADLANQHVDARGETRH